MFKFQYVLILLFFLLGVTVPESYASADTHPSIYIEDHLQKFDQPPVIINGRTLVPLRGVFEALGSTVNWDQATQTVIAQKDSKIVSLKIGSNMSQIKGESTTLDVPPRLINNRIMVPLRFIAESFQERVVWNDKDNSIQISKVTEDKSGYNTNIGLKDWKNSLSQLATGQTGIINVSVIGDSITEGGITGKGVQDYLTHSYVGRIRAALSSKYGDTGTGFISVYFPNGSPYWKFLGKGWSENGNFVGNAGFYEATSTNGDTATLDFNGSGIGIVVAKGSHAGKFNVSIDGATATTYDSNSDSLVPAFTYEITGLTDGSHKLTITSTSTDGKQLFLLGAYPIKGTSGVRVNMVGKWGSIVSQSSSDNALPSEINIWKPKLTIIAYTANDYTHETPIDTYKQNLQKIIDRAKKYGDVLLVSTGLRTETEKIPQSQYAQAQLDLAIQNNIAYIDIFDRWSGNANYAKNTLGFISDTVHPNDKGHQDIADAILAHLLDN